MRPLAMLLGILLGSSVAVTLSLAVVAFVFLLLRAEYPRLQSELQPLVASVGIFGALTTVTAASFYGELKSRAWRWPVLALLLAALGGVAWYYWPR